MYRSPIVLATTIMYCPYSPPATKLFPSGMFSSMTVFSLLFIILGRILVVCGTREILCSQMVLIPNKQDTRKYQEYGTIGLVPHNYVIFTLK